ncbi:DUF7149 domain-containing protein [Brachyspira sp.]|uniref:type IIG restriction enzyme/methyltransferase n=1 Tax=Brachyspira sp. TaxID=1977261 RepID=UPI003D7E2FA3
MAERLEFVKIEVKDFINQYFYRYKILENEFEKFKESLINYIETLEKHKNQNEDFLVANCLAPFFNNINFETQIKSKMKGKSEIDLSIVKDSNIQIIIEAKKPNDKDFFGDNNANCKALHEAVLYYFRIREENNFSIKYIILTDFYKFYIFEAKEFEKVFYRNKDFEMLYKSFKNKNSMFNGKTEEFYLEAKNILERKNFNLKGTFVDLNGISDILKENKNFKTNFKYLKPYFKIFSRDFLLQEFNPNDANELNKGFYDELLHILGLSEKIINGKTLIVPSKNSIDREGTLYYNILQRLPEDKRDKKENEINEKVLEILIIWINRILFLKLLESSLINFNNDKNLGFLNIEKIKDYNKLNYLFFNILAKNKEDRNGQTAEDLAYLPYLNSSLFTRSEKEIIDISQLSNLKLEYFKNTQIKDGSGHAKKGKEDWLKMIFEFLNSFDFGARDDNENILAQKDLINSSVLGLVFEKLNGYKEGSFYTPSFITSYMCKESLEKIVLQKFRENGLNADNLDILQKQILANMNADFNFRDKAINILEEIRICDPAVGSGHFLVSALNETVYIYYKLGLLNIPISDLRIENDEILIKDLQGKNFEYSRPKFENDNHKIQREIFNLKKSIIENNLFGVDINNNSCEITKLRLWIELLKNSYYLSFDNGNYHNLQTLPNIDINIKCGNSLISYFDINQSLNRYPNIQDKIVEYKELVKNYKDGVYSSKSEIDEKIKELLESFRTFCLNDKFFEQINKFHRLCREYSEKYGNYLVKDDKNLKRFFGQENLFVNEFNKNEAKKDFEILIKKYNEIYNLEAKRPFEWRFAFPEILNDDGGFVGFDLIIGNPPYIRQEEIKELKPNLQKLFSVYKGTSDIYTYFYEQGFKVLKDNGILNFITSNKFTRAGYGEPLRDFLLKNTSILEFVDLNGIKVFASATVDTSIVMFRKKKPNKSQVVLYANPKDNNLDFLEYNKIEQGELNKNAFIFGESKILNLKKKIEKIGIPLKDFGISINRGITTGLNEAFIIDEKTKNKLIAEDKKSAELIKPLIRGRDINRYNYEFQNLYLINTHNGVKEKNISPIDINKYPAIKKHLDKYYSDLEIRQDKGITPYNLRNCTYIEDFEKPKIVYQEICLNASYSFDDKNSFLTNNAYMMISPNYNLKLLLGLLNSKLYWWFFTKNNVSLGSSGVRMLAMSIEVLPIPKIDTKNKKLSDKIINNVDEILKIKSKNFNADVSEIEREIDRMVYELYELSEEEVGIIENRN